MCFIKKSVHYGLDIIVRYDKTVMCYFMSTHETPKKKLYNFKAKRYNEFDEQKSIVTYLSLSVTKLKKLNTMRKLT